MNEHPVPVADPSPELELEEPVRNRDYYQARQREAATAAKRGARVPGTGPRPVESPVSAREVRREMMKKQTLPPRLRNQKKRVSQGREPAGKFHQTLHLHERFNEAFARGADQPPTG